MAGDPWTSPDPEPGDFDAALERIDPSDVEVHEGAPDARLTVLLDVNGPSVPSGRSQ